MTKKQHRRTYTAEFKSKVALEALDERVSASALSKRYDIHPSLICQWKKSVEANSHRLFEASYPEKDEIDREIEALKKKNETLRAECDFLKSNLSLYLNRQKEKSEKRVKK